MRHIKINLIDNISTEKPYLSWEQNSLEEEFVKQKYEEVQDEDGEEAQKINTEV